MEIVTTFNFLAIFIAFVGRITRKEKACFLFAIIMLTIFYSIRTDYGNDLPAYINLFEFVSVNSFSGVIDIINNDSYHFEPGWVVLNYLFKPFGWQTFISFITIIQFSAVYLLITRYVSLKHYWLVFAIYILNSSLLLTCLSMLRQALAMHIVVFSLPFILNKRYLIAICLILLATTFHTSAFVAFLLIPLLFASRLNVRLLSIIFLVTFVVFSISEYFIGNILNSVIESDSFERYAGYANDEIVKGTGIGVLIKVLTSLWLLTKYAKDNISRFLIIVYCLFVVITPFIYAIQLVARVATYFCLISIAILPKLADFKHDIIGCCLFAILFYTFISGYFGFFDSPIWHDAFSVYRTVFD